MFTQAGPVLRVRISSESLIRTNEAISDATTPERALSEIGQMRFHAEHTVLMRLIDRLTARARAMRTEKITILGSGEIDLMLALARLGYADVTCRDVARTPHIPTEAADLVIAPSVKDDAELETAVAEAKRTLRPGGVFLARVSKLARSAALGEPTWKGFQVVAWHDDGPAHLLLRCLKVAQACTA